MPIPAFVNISEDKSFIHTDLVNEISVLNQSIPRDWGLRCPPVTGMYTLLIRLLWPPAPKSRSCYVLKIEDTDRLLLVSWPDF